MTGKGRATIRRHLKDGTLSCETDKDGNRVIDASELMRVYKDDCDFDREEGVGQRNRTKRIEKPEPTDIKDLKTQYEARIEQFVATIERLEKELDQAHERDRESQESYKQSLRLLEDHSAKTASSEDWKAAIAVMETKLANHQEETKRHSEQRIAELEETHKRRLARMRQELDSERNKSFWQKIFG